MFMTLGQVVKQYLCANGIRNDFFSDYIGCDPSTCTRWIKGERKLNAEQLLKVHDFLAGKHIKPVTEIMKEE